MIVINKEEKFDPIATTCLVSYCIIGMPVIYLVAMFPNMIDMIILYLTISTVSICILQELFECNRIDNKIDKNIVDMVLQKDFQKLKVDEIESEIKEKDLLIEKYKKELEEMKCKKNIINFSMTEIYQLYQGYLEIHKYGIKKYNVDIDTKELHVYCTMGIYTRIHINKEVLSYVKYHIDGTDVVI